MKLRQLAYFKAVVEHRSLAAASDVLRVAQPNLSVAIKQLEELWGVSLFERAGRGLAVTETGRALYERAAELLGSASAIDQEMRAIGHGFTTRLRVGFTQVVIEVISDVVARMRKETACSFFLQQAEPQLLELMVELRQLDFALTHMPVANPALGVEVVAPLEIILLCPHDDDRWPKDRPVTPQMLAGEPLLLLRRTSGTGIYERIVEAFSVAGVSCTVAAACTDLSAIHSLVERRVGLGLLPVHSMHVPRSGLAMYPVALGSPPERLALITPRGVRALPAVQRAMELCRTSLRAREDAPAILE